MALDPTSMPTNDLVRCPNIIAPLSWVVSASHCARA
jgi:hypothetical protein